MLDKDNNKPTKDSQRALPRNRKNRSYNHPEKVQPEETSAEKKRIAEGNAGQRGLFDEPEEIKFEVYRQPLLTGFLQLVELGKNIAGTNRQQLVFGAA